MNRAEAALPPSARPARVRSVRRKAEKDITLSVSSKKSPAAIMQSGILQFENSTFRVLFSLIRVLLHFFLHVPDSTGQDACEDQKNDPEKDIGCVAGTGG